MKTLSHDLSDLFRGSLIRVLIIVTAVLILGNHSAMVPARADEAPIDMGLNLFVTLFPELKNAPAPTPWLKVGKRWTYYYQYAGVFDPEDDTPKSGSGYFQFDLVALTATRSVASFKTYVDDGHGYLIPTPAIASIQLPGVGEFWINPLVLVNAESVANPDLTVTRLPKQIGGKTYQCVRFHSTMDDGSAEYIWMFEETTGKLIFYRDRIGDEDDPEHHTSQIWLVNERPLSLPWKGAKAQSWVTRKESWSLRFFGTQEIQYYNEPSSISLYYLVDLARTRYQQKWSEYQIDDYLYSDQTGWMHQGAVLGGTGAAQLFDALWLPAEAIPVATQWPNNQYIKLDVDPVTKATVLGKRVGTKAIVLREKGLATPIGPIYQTDMSYRQTDGRLTRTVRTDITNLIATYMIKTVTLDLQ